MLTADKPATASVSAPAAPVTIPASHVDLVTGSVHAVLATIMPGGQPQSSMVWVDYDGTNILLNTTLERQKTRNMLVDPKVTLLVIDPRNTSRWVEVRGRVVEIITEGAEAHADKLAWRYCGKRHFYGEIYTVEQRDLEHRVIVRIEPFKVSVDAIFK